MNFRWLRWLVFGTMMASVSHAQTMVPVVVATNTVIRVMAANLTSGSNQNYESPGLNIFQGLKPDVVAIQEFKYAGAIATMVTNTFGTNFSYFRESGYALPNGIISRFPIMANGSWVDTDTGVNDRGYAWAQLDLPGTNDLYVVSVHLKAGSSDATRRGAEAAELKTLILTNFPANAWIIVAGDMNLFSETEAAITTFKTFLSDSPVPADQNGERDTNAGRSQRYDRVLPSFSLTNLLVPVVMPSRTYSNGLVFDSRIYTPLAEVAPVQIGDSGANQMQHMAVVKDFRILHTMTNYVTVTPPHLTLLLTNTLHWSGLSNVAYRIQTSINLTNWTNAGTVISTSTNLSFTNENHAEGRMFYRVVYP